MLIKCRLEKCFRVTFNIKKVKLEQVIQKNQIKQSSNQKTHVCDQIFPYEQYLITKKHAEDDFFHPHIKILKNDLISVIKRVKIQ